MFVAYGSSVRCFQLFSQLQNSKWLNIRGTSFDIKALKINSSGSLMAIAGDDKVVVCSLPTPGAIFAVENLQLDVKTYHVGVNSVVDLCWHPVANFDSTLVVLTKQSHIVSFDLSINAQIPQQDLDLSKSHHGFGLADIVTDPISICFGSSTQSISLYILNRDGDIYALHPFIPTSIAVAQPFIESLFYSATLQFNSNPGNNAYLQQLKYVSALYKQLPTADKDIALSSTKDFTRIHKLSLPSLTLSVKIQGPFLVNPFPTNLYNFDGCQIDSLSCGDLNLMIVSWSNGECLVLLQDQDLIMAWNDGADSTTPTPSFSTIEHIQIPSSSSIKLLGTSSLSPYSYFVLLDDSNLYELDFQSWGEVLSSSITSGNPDPFLDIIPKLKSNVTLLAQDFQSGAIVSHNNSAFLVQFDSLNIKTSTKISKDKDQSPPLKTTIKLKSQETTWKADLYVSLIPGPYSLVQDLFKSVSTSDIKTQGHPLLDLNDEDSLAAMNDVSKTLIKDKIVLVNKIGINLFYRLSLQQQELNQQLSKLSNELSDSSIESLIKRQLDFELRLTTLSMKHAESKAKLDRLLKRLNSFVESNTDNHNLVISKEEQTWFDKIKTYEDQLSLLNSSIGDYKEQIKYIKNLIHTNGIPNGGALDLPASSIMKKVVKEKSYVNQLQEMLQKDLVEVDQLMNLIKI